MTIREALTKYHSIETELLLSHILGKPKEFLYMSPARELTRIQARELTRMVYRRLKGEPVSYIVGYKDFYGLSFKVNKHVLIPRPETEELVDKVLQVCKVRKEESLRILDLGTGSGCIIISLAHSLKSVTNVTDLRYYGSDVSKQALAVAKANARTHKARVTFFHSDLLQNVRMKFDVIVANLPYVTSGFYKDHIRNLGYEPKLAITDGTNQYKIYHDFFKQVPKNLHPKSYIFLEIDPPAKKQLTEWAKKYLPKPKITFHKDYHNLWRFMEIHVP